MEAGREGTTCLGSQGQDLNLDPLSQMGYPTGSRPSQFLSGENGPNHPWHRECGLRKVGESTGGLCADQGNRGPLRGGWVLGGEKMTEDSNKHEGRVGVCPPGWAGEKVVRQRGFRMGVHLCQPRWGKAL